jgi:hypothetical protein
MNEGDQREPGPTGLNRKIAANWLRRHNKPRRILDLGYPPATGGAACMSNEKVHSSHAFSPHWVFHCPLRTLECVKRALRTVNPWLHAYIRPASERFAASHSLPMAS